MAENLKFPQDIESNPEYPSKVRIRIYDSDLSTPTDTIVLPVPIALSNNYGVNFDDIETGLLSRTLASAGIESTREALSTLIRGDYSNAVSKATAAAAGVAGEATLSALLSSDATNLLRSQVGFNVNKSAQLAINKPQNRTFSLRFEFVPKNENEAISVEKIISTLKIAMHPQTSRSGTGIESGFFYLNPARMQIDFLFSDQNTTNAKLFRTWYCFLTGMEVNYHNAGAASYLPGGYQTNKSISLNFTEISPLARSKIQELELTDFNDVSTRYPSTSSFDVIQETVENTSQSIVNSANPIQSPDNQ